MKKAKNNQAESHFSYKNDDVDLTEVGQFLRDTFKYRVEREWFIVFDKRKDHQFQNAVYCETIPNRAKWDFKNPDLILIDKKTNKLILVIEIDGSVHDKKFLETEQRNEKYFMAGIPLLVINKLEITTTIFDLIYKKVSEIIGN